MLERRRPPSSVEAELQQAIGKAQLKAALLGGPREPVLVGRFELGQRLGCGSMGVVYEAFDPLRGRPVALKLLQYPDAKAILRLKREFRSLAALSHPNLVGLDALYCDRGVWFFSMELVASGMHFDAWIASAPARERLARLGAALAQLVTAVDILHQAGKLHRDLKPSNVLVSAEGRVVVVDFGLVIDTTGTDTLQTGMAGTPAYLAPEQAQARAACPASDWYAVGVMLFETLTGRRPFDGPAMQVVRDKQVARPQRARDLLRQYDPAQVADLCELCDALLSADPDERPPVEVIRAVVLDGAKLATVSRGVPAGLHGDDSTWPAQPALFVGREPELSALRAAHANMRAGATVTLFLSGHSGVGKSALLDRFISEIDADTLVLRGRCHENECVPYKVFDEVVAALASKLRSLPAAELEALVPRHAQSLQLLFPELGRPEAFARRSVQRAAEDPRELRNEAFAGLNELLLRITDARPLLIVVDDLQWGDVDSARMLGHLLGAPEPAPFLLLGAYRRDEVERSEFLAEVLQRSRPDARDTVRVIEVEPLPRDAAEQLAQHLLEREGLGDDRGLAACIAHEAQGLAFFIGELVRHHVASAARLPAQTLSLERAILERVALLPSSAQRLLRVLCIASAPLEQHVALRAAELAPDEREATNALRAARLLRGHPGQLADELEVYHDRVREIVVAQLDAEVVRDVHARIAEALEAFDISDPERLVTHYARAGDRVRAAARAIQGAEAASGQLAFNRAAELLRVALEHSHDPVQRRGLERRLGDVLVTAGRGADAAAAYLRAAEDSDPRTAHELQRLAAMHYLRSGRTALGLELASRVFAVVDLSMPAHGVRALGAYAWQRARLELRPLALGRPQVPASPTQLERLDCMLAVFPELSFSDPVRGAVLQAQFLNEALAAGEPQRLLQGLVYEVFNLARLGGRHSRRRALSALEKARELALQLDTAYARGMVHLAEASYHFWSACAFQSVLLPCTLAREAFGEVGSEASLERGLVAFMHLTALEFSGGLSELCSGGMQMLREAQERDDRFVAMLAVLSVPCAYAMRGQAEDGLRLLREQERFFPSGYSTFRQLWLIRMADMFNYLGRPTEALDVLARHWSEFLRSSHRHTVLAGGAMHATRARTALMSYLECGDRALLEMLRSDLQYLRRSPTLFRYVVDTANAALMWQRGERQSARRALEEVLPRLRAADSENGYIYTQLAHARLSGDADKRRELVARLRAQGVHNPERWAWTYVPIGERP